MRHFVHQDYPPKPITANPSRIKMEDTIAFVTITPALAGQQPMFSHFLGVFLEEPLAGKPAKADSIVGKLAGKVPRVVVAEESFELCRCHAGESMSSSPENL